MVTDKFKVGNKVKVIRTKSTVQGTLYEDEICKIDSITHLDYDVCIKDNVGRKWYVDFCDISLID